MRLAEIGCWIVRFAASAFLLGGQVTWGQPSSLELKSISDVPVQAVAIDVNGHTAYVADKGFGVWIYDLSDHDTLRLIGSYQTPGEALDVAIDGTMLYVCDAQFGLLVLYVGHPDQPVLMGLYATTTALALDVGGGRAYVASGNSGLVIYDVSIPNQPVPLDSLSLPGYALDVALSDTLVAALTDTHLELFHRTPDAELSVVGSVLVGDEALALSLYGDYAFIAAPGKGLQIVSMADRAHPVMVGSYRSAGALSVFATESSAYLAYGEGGLKSFDVSDPTNPLLVNQEFTANIARAAYSQAGVVYLANTSDVRTYVESSGEMLLHLLSASETPGEVLAVDTGGTVLYVSDGESGVRTYDISNPDHPAYLGSSPVAGGAFDTRISDTILYVAAGGGSLQAFNVADPHLPIRLGLYNSPGIYASDLELSQPYAYVVYGMHGLTILDLSYPWKPALAGELAVPGVPKGIVVQDTFAYVASSAEGGLQIVNLVRRDAPEVIGSLGLPDAALDLDVAGSVAYVACRNGGLQVVDVSDPRNPVLLGHIQTGGLATAARVMGAVCYLADDFGGLKVLDISNPALPKLLQTVPTTSPAFNLCPGNGVIYLATQKEVQTYSVGPALISLNGGSESLPHVLDPAPVVTWTLLDTSFLQIAYELQVGTDEDWSVAELWDTDSVPATVHGVAYAGDPLLDGQTYYARLRLASFRGWDRWSNRRFSTNTPPGPPLMLSPPAGATADDRHPVLMVEATPELDGDRQQFEFSVYTHDSILLTRSPLTPTAPVSPGYKRKWAVDSALVDFETYYWSARSWDGFEWSSSTDWQSFSIHTFPQPPAQVGLIGPGYQSIVYSLRPTFLWRPGTDPNMFDTIRYALQLDDTSAFSSPSIFDGLLDTVYTLSDPLASAHRYWWDVKSQDQTGLSTLTWTNQLRIYSPGDVNASWDVTTSDIVKLVNYLFKGEALGVPECAGSADGNAQVSVVDIVRLVNFVLRAGSAPLPGCD